MAIGDFFKNARTRRNNANNNDRPQYEYYEDTHNERGEYIGNVGNVKKNEGQAVQNADIGFVYSTTPKAPQAKPLPTENDYVQKRNYQNVVVYEPTSGDDVQVLIDYLKRREPAIINLDNVEADDAQRILDFVSGAIYALNGSVHRIASNIFLLSPEGVEITVPYEPN